MKHDKYPEAPSRAEYDKLVQGQQAKSQYQDCEPTALQHHMSRLSGLIESLDQLDTRARAIADRMFGPQPAHAEERKDFEPCGVVSQLARQTELIGACINNLAAEISRIESL